MKIIEGMKELKLIEKKIIKNNAAITMYASAYDTERLAFNTEAEQKEEVSKLVQSNIDYISRYAMLKANLDRTNLQTKVQLQGKEYTIHELILTKRRLGALKVATYNSLNEDYSSRRRSTFTSVATGTGKSPVIIKYYDEKEKNEKLNELENLLSAIDSRLEVVNAITDIVE